METRHSPAAEPFGRRNWIGEWAICNKWFPVRFVLAAANCGGQTGPMDAALAAFREGLPERTTLGAESARTRDELVMRFVRALEGADTAAFAPMMLSRAEYAWLYYPMTRHVRPPYELEAGLLWFFIVQNAEKGIGRALGEYGGVQLGYRGYRCGESRVEGKNVVWEQCVLDITVRGEPVEKRLFGTILERGDRFKFVSYANDL
ncbi:MAG: hypothetical protein ACREL7_18225 [Longimicrobiales bacterium]